MGNIPKIPNVLTIAGSDPSGGAGIQADLKTFAALGCYGMSVITALTAQNTQGVHGIEPVSPQFVLNQIASIFDDIRVDAVKIGMVADPDVIAVIADALEKYAPRHVVLDPVMVATSGDALISSDAVEALKTQLIPLVDVITPNIPEAQKLLRKAVLDMEGTAKDLLSLGCDAALLKGGHGSNAVCTDVLATHERVYSYEAPRIDTENTHGTGCTLASAVAAYLAHGLSLDEAVGKAKDYITGAIKHADALDVGHGHGPVHHFWNIKS